MFSFPNCIIGKIVLGRADMAECYQLVSRTAVERPQRRSARQLCHPKGYVISVLLLRSPISRKSYKPSIFTNESHLALFLFVMSICFTLILNLFCRKQDVVHKSSTAKQNVHFHKICMILRFQVKLTLSRTQSRIFFPCRMTRVRRMKRPWSKLLRMPR